MGINYLYDGSSDNNKTLIREIKEYSFKIILLNFSINFGKQPSLQANIDNCSVSAAIIIDADLQDPPEVAERMIEKWEIGYEVVYGQKDKKIPRKILRNLKHFFLIDYLIFFRNKHTS